MGRREGTKDEVNLLDKFHIKIDDIKNYHIIGVDPGAGEWAAARVSLLGDRIDMVKDLYVLNDGRTCKDFSVLYYSQKGKDWEIGERAGKRADNEEAVRGFYENFKVLPGSPAAMECYGHYFENPTMEELMVQNFKSMIKRLFVDGNNGLEGKKYIFFVGRPASKDWEKAELEYRNMLYQGLEIEGVEKDDIQIAMVSEAQASLAAEIYGKGLDLELGHCQVVIDVGSSTVDAIIVKEGKVIGEYSRQIGAGSIEENILELFLYDDCDPKEVGMNHLEEFFSQDSQYKQMISDRKKLREKLSKSPYINGKCCDEFKFSKIRKFYEVLDMSAALNRFFLRINKEGFFGEDGKGGTKRNGQTIGINGEEDYFPINNNTMEKAVYKMPIYVPCTEYGEKDNPYKGSCIYRSYYDALAHFIDGVKEMHLAGESEPDVILTGGASVMPFVGRLVWEKLGVVPTNSTQPSYTVSRGLAYIGYAEIKKQEELVAISRLIDKVFADKKWSLSYDVRKAFAKWQMDVILSDLCDWKTSGTGISLQEVVYKTSYYSSEKIGEMDLVREWWKNEVKPEIVKEIKERFEALYQNADVQYDFVINPQIVENAYREGGTTIVRFSWLNLFGVLSGLFLNPDKKDYDSGQREKYYNKAKEHRTAMEEKIRDQQSVMDLAERHANEILNGFKEELYKDVVIYVEGLTPYIVRQ